MQCSPPLFALSERVAHHLQGVEVVAVPVLAPAGDRDGDGPILGPGAEALSGALGVDLLDVLEASRSTGATGEITSLAVPDGGPENQDLRLVLLVGIGSQGPDDLRRAGAALARAVRGRGTVATSVAAATDEAGLEAFVVGATLGSFVFHWRSTGPADPPVQKIVLAGLPDAERNRSALTRAEALGRAGWRTRTLATVPANLKSPQWLAEQAEQVARDSGLTCRVWDEDALAREGFGGLLDVGRASATPPRLVRLDYAPPKATRRTPTVVLVGKGITFDSGGLSIKPAESMSTMKRDMTGAAVVLSTLAALRDLGCPVRVVGLLACAENAVSGDALRPGDVVRHYGGRTTEITNTDAEGRLVMADALAYAVGEIRPDAVVDVATLTGAAKVALGQQVAAVFADDDALAEALLEAGECSGERLWRLPLHAAYQAKLASEVADADNAPSGPGAIMAALFLQHFTGDVPWAHLDIAPVGDVPEDAHEWTAGPSGFGARVLLTWLCGTEPLRGVGATSR